MTARQVFRGFKELYYCYECKSNTLERDYKADKCRVREEFNNYVDSLQCDGQISERTANTITISQFLGS